MVFASRRDGIDIGLRRFVEVLGIDQELFVAARSSGDPAVIFNRGGKNEAVVVVGVLSDKVYAAWRAINDGSRSKACAKVFLKLNRISQVSVLFQTCLGRGRGICGRRRGKIGHANANYGVSRRNIVGLFGPDAVDASVLGG